MINRLTENRKAKMKPPRPIIVAYDISDNKTRRRIFKILREWRLDGQKSVCDCRLTRREAEELFLQLSEPLDKKTDSLVMVWLEPHRKVLWRGLGKTGIGRPMAKVRGL